MNCAPTQLVMKRLRYILKITEIPKVSNSVHYKSQKLYKITKTSDAEFFKLNNYIILFYVMSFRMRTQMQTFRQMG